MEKERVLSAIKDVARSDIPQGAKVILFGSQARGDTHKDSDWDLLILLDKSKLTSTDYDLYSYPFWELGWTIDAMIHPTLYTFKDWEGKVNPIFRSNVKRDGIELC